MNNQDQSPETDIIKSYFRNKMRLYREANPEKVKTYQQNYYKNNSDRFKAYSDVKKQRYHTDEDYKNECIERAKQAYQTHKDEIVERNKRYFQENKEKIYARRKEKYQLKKEQKQQALTN